MILVKISEPFHRPWLKPGQYVTIELCAQVNFNSEAVTEDIKFHPKISYTPIATVELRQYLQGLHHMSKMANMETEMTYEAPASLTPYLPEGVQASN